MIQLQVASGTGQVESSYSTATARLAQLRVRVPAPAASPDSEPAKPDSETQAQNAGPRALCVLSPAVRASGGPRCLPARGPSREFDDPLDSNQTATNIIGYHISLYHISLILMIFIPDFSLHASARPSLRLRWDLLICRPSFFRCQAERTGAASSA
jgi:hypothetical protein